MYQLSTLFVKITNDHSKMYHFGEVKHKSADSVRLCALVIIDYGIPPLKILVIGKANAFPSLLSVMVFGLLNVCH